VGKEIRMQLLLASLALCAGPTEGPDTVVVCPRAWLAALEPWMAHRQQQGHRLKLVSNLLPADAIRDAIRSAAQSGSLQHVLLVGDADPVAETDAAFRARCAPTHLVPARVNIRWGSEPEIATDNWYADLDDDGVPDVTIGRLPADTPAEVEVLVRKILRYEQPAQRGSWQRQIHVVAGVGGFGSLTDSVLELATKKLLTDGIPAAYQTTFAHGSWQSPYCPDPRLFSALTRERLNEGSLFWVYIGHGRRRSLDAVHVPGGAFPILNATEACHLQCAQGSPIAVLLACSTGAFDKPTDCLAEELVKAPGGPVAALCGSRVTMPYAMAVLGEALMDECFRQHRPTLGEAFLHAKRRLAGAGPSSGNRQLLDAVAAAFSPTSGRLADERREHLALFNLLGDPLLRLAYPQEVELQAPNEAVAGQTLQVAGRCPTAGTGVIELACRRDRTKTDPPTRSRFYPTDEFLRSFNAVFLQVNDGVWVSQPFQTEGGEFRTEVPVPVECRGSCDVRLLVSGSQDVVIGSASVFVRRPPDQQTAAAVREAAAASPRRSY
jgi:hypothetical protein